MKLGHIAMLIALLYWQVSNRPVRLTLLGFLLLIAS